MSCSLLPHIGQMTRTRWVDMGSETPASAKDRHVYVSEVAFAQVAPLLGYVPGGELITAQRTLVSLEAELVAARAQVAELQAAWDAIDRVERLGFEAKAADPSPESVPVAVRKAPAKGKVAAQ